MAVKSNQDIDLHYFKLFRRIYPVLNGQVTGVHEPGPDIIIDDGERRLGIEVTNFYLERGELPESEQKQRKIREDILKKAYRIYMDKGGEYQISFSFNKEQPIHNGQKLISKIVEVIQRIEATRTRGISKYFLKDIRELDFVYIDPNLYVILSGE